MLYVRLYSVVFSSLLLCYVLLCCVVVWCGGCGVVRNGMVWCDYDCIIYVCLCMIVYAYV